jgi:hypothetical protein
MPCKLQKSILNFVGVKRDMKGLGSGKNNSVFFVIPKI